MMGCLYVNGPCSDNLMFSDSGHPSDDGHGGWKKRRQLLGEQVLWFPISHMEPC